jgi:tRNA (guanine-N7-)-methyltransferase
MAVGCGYGGLLVSLAPLFPETLMLGIEIRGKVEEYVRQRIVALREEKEGHSYQNISVLRSNSMKFMVNYFEKAQLSKMFILFPDPHFKKKKHKARIITPQLLAEYAYVIRPGGLLYTATDVHELHEWMVRHISAHPMFRQLTDEELQEDVCVNCVMQKTEEGIKVARNNGSKYLAVFERIQVPKGDWHGFSLLKEE